MSIEALPIGSNAVSFAWTETARGAEYTIDAKEDGWSYAVKVPAGATYYLNGAPVTPNQGKIRMSHRQNQLLVVPAR
jgi:hypothetical protein